MRGATLIVVEDLAGPSVRGRGGHALYVLQTLLGLERLGHRVVFVEVLEHVPDVDAVAAFTALTTRWWHEDSCALLGPDGSRLAGMTDDAFDAAVAGADGVITLAAHYRAEPWPRLERVRPRCSSSRIPRTRTSGPWVTIRTRCSASTTCTSRSGC